MFIESWHRFVHECHASIHLFVFLGNWKVNIWNGEWTSGSTKLSPFCCKRPMTPIDRCLFRYSLYRLVIFAYFFVGKTCIGHKQLLNSGHKLATQACSGELLATECTESNSNYRQKCLLDSVSEFWWYMVYGAKDQGLRVFDAGTSYYIWSVEMLSSNYL
jgi:hypothetical protein